MMAVSVYKGCIVPCPLTLKIGRGGCMNTKIKSRCEQLIENRDRAKTVFSWDGGLIHLACAGIYSAKGKIIDPDQLRECQMMLKQNVGIFSNFRGVAKAPVTAMIASSANPKLLLERGLDVYTLLKQHFWDSAYLPLAAMIIAQTVKPYRFEEIALRTRKIYEEMKQKHPILTSSEDSAFCALLALADQPEEKLLDEIERCYQRLTKTFSSTNAVQSLSHALALCDGTAEKKCEQTVKLYELLRARGYKFGTGYELPVLGILAVSEADMETTVTTICEVDDWLAKQKGFGIFGSITKKQRLMYAGILAKEENLSDGTVEAAAVGGTLSLLIAQEVALTAACASTMAAAASTADS